MEGRREDRSVEGWRRGGMPMRHWPHAVPQRRPCCEGEADGMGSELARVAQWSPLPRSCITAPDHNYRGSPVASMLGRGEVRGRGPRTAPPARYMEFRSLWSLFVPWSGGAQRCGVLQKWGEAARSERADLATPATWPSFGLGRDLPRTAVGALPTWACGSGANTWCIGLPEFGADILCHDHTLCVGLYSRAVGTAPAWARAHMATLAR